MLLQEMKMKMYLLVEVTLADVPSVEPMEVRAVVQGHLDRILVLPSVRVFELTDASFEWRRGRDIHQRETLPPRMPPVATISIGATIETT
jgi:hypothetical protein